MKAIILRELPSDKQTFYRIDCRSSWREEVKEKLRLGEKVALLNFNLKDALYFEPICRDHGFIFMIMPYEDQRPYVRAFIKSEERKVPRPEPPSGPAADLWPMR